MATNNNKVIELLSSSDEGSSNETATPKESVSIHAKEAARPTTKRDGKPKEEEDAKPQGVNKVPRVSFGGNPSPHDPKGQRLSLTTLASASATAEELAEAAAIARLQEQDSEQARLVEEYYKRTMQVTPAVTEPHLFVLPSPSANNTDGCRLSLRHESYFDNYDSTTALELRESFRSFTYYGDLKEVSEGTVTLPFPFPWKADTMKFHRGEGVCKDLLSYTVLYTAKEDNEGNHVLTCPCCGKFVAKQGKKEIMSIHHLHYMAAFVFAICRNCNGGQTNDDDSRVLAGINNLVEYLVLQGYTVGHFMNQKVIKFIVDEIVPWLSVAEITVGTAVEKIFSFMQKNNIALNEELSKVCTLFITPLLFVEFKISCTYLIYDIENGENPERSITAEGLVLVFGQARRQQLQ